MVGFMPMESSPMIATWLTGEAGRIECAGTPMMGRVRPHFRVKLRLASSKTIWPMVRAVMVVGGVEVIGTRRQPGMRWVQMSVSPLSGSWS